MNVKEIIYEAVVNGWKVSKNENKEKSYVFEKINTNNQKLVKDLEELYLYGSKKKRKNSKKIDIGKNAKN